MSYVYDQRKRPQGPQNTAPERTNAPGPGHNALTPGTAASQSSPSFDLAGAMQARMAKTFGDQSAVRNYTPPARTQAPLQAGPYSGAVTHTLSSAGPSPSAAGPMQAKRDEQAAQNVAPSVDIEAPGVSQFPSPNDIAALQRKKQGAQSPDLIGPQISVADMNRLREIRPQNIMNEPPRPESAAGLSSPKKRSAHRSRSDKIADKLFRVGAGDMARVETMRIEQDKAYKKVKPVYYQQEIEKGNNAEDAEIYSDNSAYSYAYQQGEKFKNSIISKKDKEWFDQTLENADADLVGNLNERRKQAAANLMAYRENLGKQLPGEDEGKLDFETSLSNEARTMNIYDRVLSNLVPDGPGMREYRKKIRNQPPTKEELKFMDKAMSLSMPVSDKIRGSKYFKSEGKARLPELQERNIEILTDMYKNGGKKKK